MLNPYRMMTGLLLAAAFGGAVQAQTPVVAAGGIVNHYSYARSGMPNANIAQGSIFDIYGTNIGPATLTQFSGFPIPTSIAGTSVQVTVGGTTLSPYLFFVATGQIVGILPSRTPVGSGTLTVTVNGRTSVGMPITVVPRSIGILSVNQAGNGQAAVQIPDALGNVPLNSETTLLHPGSVGVFYGTGAGAVPFDESQAAPYLNLDTDIKAIVGGVEAKILFKGRTPGLAGLDQFNVEIPAGVSGCRVPVAFVSNSIVSNLTTIAVSASGACPDPAPPTELPTSGIHRVGGIVLVRSNSKTTTEIIADAGSASFTATDYSKIKSSPQVPYTQIGSCQIATLPTPDNQVDNTGAISYLNGGTAVTVQGPNGTKTLVKNAYGFSSLLGQTAFPGQVPVPDPPYLSPGTYTVDNGAGGPDVGPFKVSVTVGQQFQWTNAEALATVPRGQDVDVTWSGADPNGYVYIGGTALTGPTGVVGATFTCIGDAKAGKFTIPSLLLMSLPPSVVTSGISSGQLSVSHQVPSVPFTASGLDEATLTYSISISRNVVYR